jgi:hypothetical protein
MGGVGFGWGLWTYQSYWILSNIKRTEGLLGWHALWMLGDNSLSCIPFLERCTSSPVWCQPPVEGHKAMWDINTKHKILRVDILWHCTCTFEKSPILLRSSPPGVVEVGERRVSLGGTQQDCERWRGVPYRKLPASNPNCDGFIKSYLEWFVCASGRWVLRVGGEEREGQRRALGAMHLGNLITRTRSLQVQVQVRMYIKKAC